MLLTLMYVLQINEFGQGSCYLISFEVHEHSLHLSIQTDNILISRALIFFNDCIKLIAFAPYNLVKFILYILSLHR